MKFLYENFFAILFTCTYKYNSANEKQLNKSNDALSLATYGKLNLKNLIRFDNNINQKLDMILQILN